MTFDQAQQYLFSLSNLRRREYMADPRQCGIYLKRVQFLLDIIGNPEKRIPHYIHVTGTSGKGSVCHFLHSILKADKKKTGLLTSPHATNITERWAINGKHMSKKEFVAIVEWLRPLLDEYIRTTPYDMVSFAELMTVIGLHYFAMHEVDYAVIEVACGGRYDATNIIPHKDAAVITNIGLDHTALWPTKTIIAQEKSGIIKKGTRVFTAEQNKIYRNIIEQEAKKQHGQSFHYIPKKDITHISKQALETTFVFREKTYNITVPGSHQVYNAALAIAIMHSLGISENAIERGLRNTKQPIRMEVVQTNPMIIVDCAHNPDKIQSTVEALHPIRKGGTKQKLSLIIGFSSGKSIPQMIRLLATLKPDVVYCTRQTINSYRKAADMQEIARALKRYAPKTTVHMFLDPQEALADARANLGKHDILLITGSLFLAGELRPYLTK